jgi:hypothetical protein
MPHDGPRQLGAALTERLRQTGPLAIAYSGGILSKQ